MTTSLGLDGGTSGVGCVAIDAAGTLLIDLRSRDWSAEILQALEMPREWLPRVHEGPDQTGTVRGDVAKQLGLPAGLTVAAGGGDNAAAAAGNWIAGASLPWWRDLLGNPDYDDRAKLAAQIPPGAEGLLFLPYLTCGGSRSALWRQILADLLQRPIVRTTADEGPAYGAAMLGGVAAGIHASVDEACAGITLRPEVEEPDNGRARLYDEHYAMYRDAYTATAALVHNLGRRD